MNYPPYKPWYGFTVWIGASLIAFFLTVTETIHPDIAGLVSLAAFTLALAWAQNGLQLRPGDWQTPTDTDTDARDQDT